MAELTVRFDLSFGSRSLRALMAASMILSAVTEVASESVTLSTYYPAPSGVYTQLITTGMPGTLQTELARDGGCVDIGTSAGCGASILNVNGTMSVTGLTVNGNLTVTGTSNLQGATTVGGALVVNNTANVTGNEGAGSLSTTGNNTYSAADPCAADIITGSSGCKGFSATRHDSSIMFWSNASASRLFNSGDVFYLSVWDTDAFNGANVALSATMGGGSVFHGPIENKQTGCFSVNVTPNGGPVPACGGYLTTVSGIYAQYMTMPFYDFASGGSGAGDPGTLTYDALCCSCPSGGCSMP